ncbi:unnamed protein product [Prunus armeniaca]
MSLLRNLLVGQVDMQSVTNGSVGQFQAYQTVTMRTRLCCSGGRWSAPPALLCLGASWSALFGHPSLFKRDIRKDSFGETSSMIIKVCELITSGNLNVDDKGIIVRHIKVDQVFPLEVSHEIIFN